MTKWCVKAAMSALTLLALPACQTTGNQVGGTSEATPGSDNPQSRMPTLDNKTIEIPGVADRVQLYGGAGEFQIAPGSSKGRVTLVKDSQRVWRSQKRTDLITVMAIENGGSGTFYYVAVYSLKAGTIELDDSALLGDRIKIMSVGIGELVHDPRADYRITIKLKERAEGAPMASEPDLPSTRVFYVTKGKLEAVDPIRDDS